MGIRSTIKLGKNNRLVKFLMKRREIIKKIPGCTITTIK